MRRRNEVHMKGKEIIAAAMVLLLLLFAGCQGAGGQNTEDDLPLEKQENEMPEQDDDKIPISGTEGDKIKDTNSSKTGGTDSLTEVEVQSIRDQISSLAEADSQDKTVLTASEPDATIVSFEEDSITAKGSGCKIEDTTVTITDAGTYVLQGSLHDGSVIVDTDKESVVRLVLNGVTITNSDSAAIFIKKSKKTIISLENGTVNTLADGEQYVYADENEDEPSAALFSKSDLTINGSGTLIVNGNYNDAIKCKDSLKLLGGIYQIMSADDGIVGKDMLVIENGSYQITAQGDGIKASNDKEEELGFVLISGGEFNIVAENDAIQAETKLLILDGSFRIVTGGGSINAEPHVDDRFDFGGWKGGSSTSTETDTESRKGLKAGMALQIEGGTFVMDTCDDALHSNGTIRIDAGEYTIATGDDGVHADTALVVYNGVITITESYEGLEAPYIIIQDGEISIVASDDGINAAGDADNISLVVNGGAVYVSAQGDGLDSNGSITINGGTIFVDGPTNGGNGALDYDIAASVHGGTVVFAGSVGMAMTPGSGSKQASIALTFPKVQAAGTSVVLYDAEGTEIFRYTPAKEFQHLVLSSSEIKRGEVYSVTYGSSTIENFTLLDTAVTHVASDGSVTDKGGMGQGVFGGFPERPNEGFGGRPDRGPGDIPDGNPEDSFGGGRRH